MTVRPHDTDRILETLGDAIAILREHADSLEEYSGQRVEVMQETANDLALLHGAVSAEAQSHDDEAIKRRESRRAVEEAMEHHVQTIRRGLPTVFPDGAKPKPIDVKPSLGHRQRYLRLLKRETIEESDRRGEHRD